MFIGRKAELEQLESLWKKKSASLVVLKGRRRIGKSRLVEQFAQGETFLRFSGIAPQEHVSAQDQRNMFAKQLGVQDVVDWMDLFVLVAKQTQKGRVLILFDEISWMGSQDPTFLGKLKEAWDVHFSKNTELILVLCGSVSTWIEENIIQGSALFGRISLCMTLEELSIRDSAEMLKALSSRLSSYEILQILSVIGGVPWYLEQIQGVFNAEDNIKNLCFRKNSALAKEFDLLFYDIFHKKSAIYKAIITALQDGPLEFGAIQVHHIDICHLEHLQEAGFVSRDFTWHIKEGKMSKLSHFRLSDQFLRFYLKCVAQHQDKISRDEFADVAISSLRGWYSVMGLQFENLILKNRKEIKRWLRIRPEDVVADNPFFQRKTTKHKGCQIDYLIQTRLKTLYVCEIKFSRQEISTAVIADVQEKIARLSVPKGFAICPVLIHANGVTDAVHEADFFTEIIDCAEVFLL